MLEVIEEVIEHAKSEYPNESCGIVLIFRGREIYHPCRNISDAPKKSFVIHPEDYAAAEDKGEIIKIVHSHPSNSVNPSPTDLVNIEKSRLPWLIVKPQTGHFSETKPTGYKAPLIGREYVWGTFDCYSIIKDYYLQELKISLPDKIRSGTKLNPNQNFFLENYKQFGFLPVKEPQRHDVILMYSGGKYPQHSAIYLGGGIMLHHVEGRLSSKDVYGNAGYWYKNTQGYYRHIDLM